MKLPLYLRVLLGLTVLGCAWLFWQDSTPPPQETPAPNTRPTPAPAPDDSPPPASDSAQALARVDIFPSQTWMPPPPAAAPVSQAPRAPPFPFTVSAQWRYQNQAKIVVLQGQGTRYTLCRRCAVPGHIEPGGKLDAHYRLEKLSDSAVVIQYLPLGQVTTLRLDSP